MEAETPRPISYSFLALFFLLRIQYSKVMMVINKTPPAHPPIIAAKSVVFILLLLLVVVEGSTVGIANYIV
jgi:hypothetical protein